MRLCGLLLILLVATGCSDEESQSSSIPKGCTEHIGSETWFIGEPRCLAALPQEEISGYWVSGHEHSAFYADRQSIRYEFDSQTPWLSLSDESWSAVKSRVTGEYQVFSVRFIGAKATMPGCYGHVCVAKSGVLMARLLEINEIEAHPPDAQGVKLR